MPKGLSIKFKLGLSILIIIAIFTSVSILAVLNFGKLITSNLEDEKSWEIISIIDGLQETTREVGITIQESDESPEKVMKNLRTEIDKDLESLYHLTAGNNEQQELLKKNEKYIDEFHTQIEDIIAANPTEDAATLKGKIMEAARPADMTDTGTKDEFREQLTRITEIEEAELLERDKKIEQIRKTTFIELIGGTLIGAIISLFIFRSMSRSVVRNIQKTSEMLKDIAEGEGDLTKRLEVKSKDEIGEMAIWFNRFIEKMNGLIGEVIENTEILYQATQEVLQSIEISNGQMREVAASVENVSTHIQSSASISEEALASIQEISGQANMIFAEANDANETGEMVLKAASTGGVSVNEAVSAIGTVQSSSKDVLTVMDELKKSSNEIGKIVALITGITEQTSLLSLNASIEAARAGEAGKGFAVVANEVKKLSEESKHSAQQIHLIVDEIQQKMLQTDDIIKKEQSYIDASSEKVWKTSEEFHNIHTYIENISNKIGTMTKASQQQTSITGEMTQAVTTLSEGLQENAATSHKISMAVQQQSEIYKEIEEKMERMKMISNELKKQTDRFKI